MVRYAPGIDNMRPFRREPKEWHKGAGGLSGTKRCGAR